MDPIATTVTLVIADCDAWTEAALETHLAADERSRAARFHHAVDRHRFVVRRGLLRRLLGESLALDPSAVPLRTGPAGKPSIDEASLGRGAAGGVPAFNLSRSGGLAVVALVPATSSRAPDVGVDLERVAVDRRSAEDLLRVADRFAAAEASFLGTLPADAMPGAFYRLWTAKEACLKCLGTGIGSTTVALDDVVCVTGRDGAVERADCPVGPVSWRVRSLEPRAGHVAAVAMRVDDGPFDVVLRRLEPDAAERRLSGADARRPGPAPEAP